MFNSQRLLDRALQKIGIFPALEVKVDNGGLTWVFDGKSRIAVVNKERANRYRHGIRRRCRHMAHRRYLGGKDVKISPGDVIVNVGANIGEVSMYFAGCGARVLALEPDPIARRCLEANTADSSVEILPYGAWKEDGPLSFFLATDSADSSAINPSENEIKIEAKMLDTVVKEQNLTNIRLIAGDAEGGEPEVLQGASEALKITDYVSLDCSFERRGEQTRDACTEILTSAGFEILNSKSRKHLIAKRKSI